MNAELATSIVHLTGQLVVTRSHLAFAVSIDPLTGRVFVVTGHPNDDVADAIALLRDLVNAKFTMGSEGQASFAPSPSQN